MVWLGEGCRGQVGPAKVRRGRARIGKANRRGGARRGEVRFGDARCGKANRRGKEGCGIPGRGIGVAW